MICIPVSRTMILHTIRECTSISRLFVRSFVRLFVLNADIIFVSSTFTFSLWISRLWQWALHFFVVEIPFWRSLHLHFMSCKLRKMEICQMYAFRNSPRQRQRQRQRQGNTYYNDNRWHFHFKRVSVPRHTLNTFSTTNFKWFCVCHECSVNLSCFKINVYAIHLSICSFHCCRVLHTVHSNLCNLHKGIFSMSCWCVVFSCFSFFSLRFFFVFSCFHFGKYSLCSFVRFNRWQQRFTRIH